MDVDIDNIIFGFDKQRPILNGISLRMKGDSIVAVVGASGCGKSTFLRLICGIIQKSKTNLYQGRIYVDGFSPEEYIKQGKLGFMFQEAALFPNLSVRDNILLPLQFLKKPDTVEVNKLMSTVGLSDFSNYLPAQLSGGMKTRVALARAFVTKPSLLLLDEPFSSLDVRWKFYLYRELETLRKTYSTTIVMVTHDIQEALLLSNHILVFGREGTVLKELQIQKPLPRVFKEDAIRNLQEEYIEIQKLIMND